MFVFGFEATKFTHIETLDGRQGSINNVPDHSGHARGSNDEEKRPKTLAADTDVELDTPPRNLSVVHLKPNIPRKTYWQKLALTTTSPGSWRSLETHLLA